MHRLVSFAALLVAISFLGGWSPAIAGDYYSGGENNSGRGYHRSNYGDENYRPPPAHDSGYRHRHPTGIYSDCCYRKITKYVRVAGGYEGGYHYSDGSYYSSRPYRSRSYSRGFLYRQHRQRPYESSYGRPRYYGSDYSNRSSYYDGGNSYRRRHYDSNYLYSARSYVSGYGPTNYSGSRRFYSGYDNSYVSAADCYSRRVKIDDERGGWVWGRLRVCD